MTKKSEQKVLEIKNLTVQFSSGGFVNTAVDAVSLDVHKGEIVGLVGESGSGKTTIGRAVMCLNSYAVGEVVLLDRVLPKDANKVNGETNKWMARNVQMVFQDPASSLHPNRRIGSIVAEGLYNQSRASLFSTRKENFERANEISDATCRIAIATLSKKEAAIVVAQEEASQVARLRDSYPWSAANNDWELYKQDRHNRETTNLVNQQLEVVGEDYDQLFENRVLYKTTISLARKEKYAISRRKDWDKDAKLAAYGKIDRKIAAGRNNYLDRKAQLFTKLDQDITVYKKMQATYQEESKKLQKGTFDAATLERFAADFAKLRNKYLRQLEENRVKFVKIRSEMTASKRAESLPSEYKKRVEELVTKNAPLSRKKLVSNRVNEMLYNVQLSKDYVSRYPGQLSGGQQQRVGVARAIALRPKLLVADEPISSLDVSIQAQVVNIIKDLNEQDGLSVLFIAHDLRMVRYISDRIAVMNRGRIVEIGTADEVYANPLHPYTRNLLKAVPSIERIGESLSTKEGVVFERGYDTTFYWHWCSPSHRILATAEEAATWNLKVIKREASNYVAIK